ncbi:ribosomal-processing cysteine protease Prp [Anoxybacillus sp. J5B_2022]|uniref:ribosomal-processing cysteine protease Prp n=1 Tax=Anoxybacillus sp. J5B_2022 TaxID=3003246 RepID=UPI002286004C|nr:ribosomal-processing cysteine protease Prp [Anoxybacillus sp. J5B_2022]MCZ0756664.1 ribosomal-processing cysteine protease Prp [Anoxybacillus sp. J5B_2022]
MIHVEVERTDDGKIAAFTMSGHAQFAKRGQDIVCAGASAVSFGSINAIIALTNVKPRITQGEKGGYLRCELPVVEDAQIDEKVQLLLEAMLVSLQTIEKDYGKYIRIADKTRR